MVEISVLRFQEGFFLIKYPISHLRRNMYIRDNMNKHEIKDRWRLFLLVPQYRGRLVFTPHVGNNVISVVALVGRYKCAIFSGV